MLQSQRSRFRSKRSWRNLPKGINMLMVVVVMFNMVVVVISNMILVVTHMCWRW